MSVDRKELRKIRDDFQRELAQREGSLERLYAETSNRFAAMTLYPGLGSEEEISRLDTILTIAEGELAAAYMKEHGWQLGKHWEKKEV